MLFKHPHVCDGHASVNGFSHIVNRQQGDLEAIKINNLAAQNVWLGLTLDGLGGQKVDRVLRQPACSLSVPSDDVKGSPSPCWLNLVFGCTPRYPHPANAAEYPSSCINHFSSQTSEIFGQSCLALDIRCGRYVVRSAQLSSLRTLCVLTAPPVGYQKSA